MKLKNKWNFNANLKIHMPIPQEHRRMDGTLFQTFTIDPSVGKETMLLIYTDPSYSRKLASLKPFDIKATTGVVRTSTGLIEYIIWMISTSGRSVGDYEHQINPFDSKVIHLINDIAQQTHLHVLIIDSWNSEVVGFFEFENNFGFEKFAEFITESIINEPIADFSKTVRALEREYSVEDMKGLTGI